MPGQHSNQLPTKQVNRHLLQQRKHQVPLQRICSNMISNSRHLSKQSRISKKYRNKKKPKTQRDLQILKTQLHRTISKCKVHFMHCEVIFRHPCPRQSLSRMSNFPRALKNSRIFFDKEKKDVSRKKLRTWKPQNEPNNKKCVINISCENALDRSTITQMYRRHWCTCNFMHLGKHPLRKIVPWSWSERFLEESTGDPHVLDRWCVIREALQWFLASQIDQNPLTVPRDLTFSSKGCRSSRSKLDWGFRGHLICVEQLSSCFVEHRIGTKSVCINQFSVMKPKRKESWEASVGMHCEGFHFNKKLSRKLQSCLMTQDSLLKSIAFLAGSFFTIKATTQQNFDLDLGNAARIKQSKEIPLRCDLVEVKVSLNLLYRITPLYACRIGEASNPGPHEIPFKLGLINPTSVYNKHDEIQTLQCHTYALSENSATSTVQNEMDARFRSSGIRSQWSPPVAPHAACTYDTAKRGQASGVSIHSHYPISTVSLTLDDNTDSTRILSSIVHIGPWHINFIVLYGIPSCHARSKDTTDKLLCQAARHANQLRLPAIIMGDLNHPISSLRSMQLLAQQGYKTTYDLFQTFYGEPMPPTCRETTCNDQMIIHPKLLPFLNHIQVDKRKIFSDHDPVICTFQLPGDLPATQTVKHPATWIPFDPQTDYMAIAYEYYAKKKGIPIIQQDHMKSKDLADALIQWTEAVEQSVDWAIRMQHADNPEKYPATHLPRNARGRAKQQKIVKKPLISCLKPSCEGQYTPKTNGHTVLLAQKVKQVRRIQSLYYRWTKLQHFENAYVEHRLQLQQEWKSILKAAGYKPTFAHWCASIPELGWCPLHLPTPEFLHLIMQFARHECDQLAAKVSSHTRKTTRYDNLFDKPQEIYAKAAKKVKSTSPDIVQEIRDRLSLPAKVIGNIGGLITLKVESTCVLQPHLPITYAGLEASINDISHDTMDITLHDFDDSLPAEGIVLQDQCHTHPEVVASKLDEFWGQFWCRDKANDFEPFSADNDPWEHFQHWMDATPTIPEVEVRLDDYKIWETALKQMNPKTARGIDSWTVDELRSLPSQAIMSISQIFHRFQGEPFPTYWQVALTIPLGKECGANTPAKTRPITVLSLIYRWWSKVVTSQILKQWAQYLPDYIVGFIPGRSPQNEMIKIQHDFEIGHINSQNETTQWQGLTLDLVKCFNLIPREPARRALRKAGIPEHLIQVWFISLKKLIRYWKFKDTVISSGLTTTGTPEGDTFSVLCCVAISRIWAHHLTTLHAVPSCYADNWSWRCQQLDINLSALDATKEFTQICRLKIDWNKTWAWITFHANKAAWKVAMKRFLPQEATLQIVTCARELGYTMHYNKTQSRKTQKQRHRAALEQVLKIRKLPVSLQIKAQLLTDACLSKALSHTETYHVGGPWFRELRAAMSRTLVPDRKITNPYLAVMLLSKYTIDPELYYIQQCIRSIRRFLHSATAAIKIQFFKIAATHGQKPMQVHGPAGTLATSLMKIGWQITATGVIHTDSMLDLHLLDSPLVSLMKSSLNSWMKNISQFCLSRQEWRNLPTIDRTATVKIFMQLSHTEQNIVSRFLTGSYMEPKQKEHIRDGPAICEICHKEEDTMHHRLLVCPQTEYIRQEYSEVIQHLENADPCHLHLPVIYQDEFYDFNTWFFHQRWDYEVNQSILEQIVRENNSGTRAMMFSDGSCRNPTHPDFRRASFSLVYHSAVNFEICAGIVDQFQHNQKVPRSFQVFTTGPCSDFQSIPRAELLAAMVLMLQGLNTILYTDSQYVVDICARLGYVLDIAQTQTWANFDILKTIWSCLQTGLTKLEKVKAHAIKITDPPTMDTFVKIGNHAADTAAKAALQHLDETSPIHGNYAEYKNSHAIVMMQMKFRHSLQVARAKCFQQQETCSNPHTLHNFQNKQDHLYNLRHEQGARYTFTDDEFDRLQNSLWGTTFSQRILTWLSTLQWPATPEPSGAQGITWFELAVNFQTAMQCGLVVNIGTTGNNFLPKQLCLHSHEYPYSKQVAAFERAITTIATLLQRDILPRRRQLSSSLRLLGSTHGKQGLVDRPQMPYQAQTLDAIRTHFQKHNGITPENPPTIPIMTPHAIIDEHWTDQTDRSDWKLRIRKYNAARRRR